MKELASLDALPPADACAVIINCGTRWYSTLALAGCRRHFDGPVLLINCGDQDGSRAHFRRLADTVDDGFHWLEWPLRKHGTALDALFARIPARRVLLVDSDLEIRGRAIVDDLFATLDAHADAYGAGFLQEATWLMPPVHKLPPHVAYYATRPWIPLVLLDVAKVRKALDAGASFLAERSHAELGGGRWARLLAHRFRLPLLCAGCRCRDHAGGCRGNVLGQRRRGSTGTPVRACTHGWRAMADASPWRRAGTGGRSIITTAPRGRGCPARCTGWRCGWACCRGTKTSRTTTTAASSLRVWRRIIPNT